MTGSNSFWFAKSDTGFYNDAVSRSLRVNSADGNALKKTCESSVTNRKKFTISAWIKPSFAIGLTSSGSARMFGGFGSTVGSGEYGQIGIYEDELIIFEYPTTRLYLRTTGLLRDRTAWYSIIVVVDTTESTAADRVKVYINGVQVTDFGTAVYYSQDFDTYWNIGDGTSNHFVGTSGATNGLKYQPFDGYIADYYFIDGSAVAYTEFGEFKEGAWIPKEYTGSFGDNGWHHKFLETGTSANSSGIGADTSGNGNHFSVDGFVAADSNILDCPENNFAVLNPLRTNRQTETYTEGNLRYASSQTSTNPATTSTIAMSSGKWYWEVFIKAQGNTSNSVGIIDVEYGMENDNVAGYNSSSGVYSYEASGSERSGGSDTSYGDSWDDDDLIGVALDMDNGNVYFYKNGTIQNSGTALQGSLDTTGSGTYSAYSLVYGSGDQIYNFGQDGTFNGEKTAQGNSDGNGKGNFFYSVPSGYLALCTANLSEPTLGPNSDEQADDHFNTVIYNSTGDGQNITGVGFAPDLVWIKCRSTGQGHGLFDTSRGTGKVLNSNATNADASSEGVKTFGSDGYTMGTYYNQSGRTYVSWNWKANGSTTTTNDASATGVGTIDSVYQANTTAGFSIVQYTGTGSAGTIAHGLGAVPKFILIKNKDDSANWRVYHGGTGESDPETDYMYLNLTNVLSDGVYMNDTAPTSTVFSIGTHNDVGSSGDDYIAYLWAEIEGYSKFGKYTGNGNDDGPYIHLGFKPKLFVVKRTDSTNDWQVMDSSRNPTNVMDGLLFWNLTNTETSDAAYNRDFLSNGVKIRGSESYVNASGGTFVYMAWAEMPEKYSNAF